jgi:hypothetical protein
VVLSGEVVRRCAMTDPEVAVGPTRDELEETQSDLVEPFERPVPIEAEPADVLEQKLDVDLDEDDYRD